MPARHPLNPYPPLTSGTYRRMTVNIPESDARLIETVCPQAGIVTALTLTLIKELADDLRSTNTTTYAPERVCDFVRRLASLRTAGEGREQHVARRTRGVRSKAAVAKKRPAPKGKHNATSEHGSLESASGL